MKNKHLSSIFATIITQHLFNEPEDYSAIDRLCARDRETAIYLGFLWGQLFLSGMVWGLIGGLGLRYHLHLPWHELCSLVSFIVVFGSMPAQQTSEDSFGSLWYQHKLHISSHFIQEVLCACGSILSSVRVPTTSGHWPLFRNLCTVSLYIQGVYCPQAFPSLCCLLWMSQIVWVLGLPHYNLTPAKDLALAQRFTFVSHRCHDSAPPSGSCVINILAGLAMISFLYLILMLMPTSSTQYQPSWGSKRRSKGYHNKSANHITTDFGTSQSHHFSTVPDICLYHQMYHPGSRANDFKKWKRFVFLAMGNRIETSFVSAFIQWGTIGTWTSDC